MPQWHVAGQPAAAMTTDLTVPSAQPEGTTLPPPPRFGEISTLTLPHGRRPGVWQGAVTRLVSAPDATAALRAAIMRAEPTPLTITL